MSSAAIRASGAVDLSTLGKRIRAVRKKMGLTANDAGKAVGVSRTSFCMWESDSVKAPDQTKLKVLSKLADINLDWLLTREGPDPDLSQTKNESVKEEGVAGVPDEPRKLDPMIAALIARIPPPGARWPREQRCLWIRTLEGSFDLIYPDDGRDKT